MTLKEHRVYKDSYITNISSNVIHIEIKKIVVLYTNIYSDVIEIKDIQLIMIHHNVSKRESNFELKYWVFSIFEKIITIKIVLWNIKILSSF